MTRKTYLRAPNDDYAPDNAIQLGHVWRNPRDPGSLIGRPQPLHDIQVNHTYKTQWTKDQGKERRGLIGVWASFLQAVGISADASISWDSDSGTQYTIPKLDTYSIEPGEDYVKASVAAVGADAVRKGQNLYMVTGIKVARGAEGSVSSSSGFAIDAKFGVDGTAALVPMEAGPKVQLSRGRRNVQGYSESSDFVFAYRVREIFYTKGVLRTREYNKGAVQGEGLVPVDEGDAGVVSEIGIRTAELGDDDVTVQGESVHFIDDDGEECDFII